MDAVTNLFLILICLSGIFLALTLTAAVIERWPVLVGPRPRRAPQRVRRSPRRTRISRPRREPGRPDDQAAAIRRLPAPAR